MTVLSIVMLIIAMLTELAVLAIFAYFYSRIKAMYYVVVLRLRLLGVPPRIRRKVLDLYRSKLRESMPSIRRILKIDGQGIGRVA